VKVWKRPLFLSDVEDCADYLFTEAGENVAREWKQSLDTTISLLRDYPELGRVRHDFPSPYQVRTFFLRQFPRYLIFYRTDRDHIELLRVRHGMMHLPNLFGNPAADG
jgi:toxin ParE1/3/4